jgi:phosphoadenosine phosphosulfate reductase
MDTAQQESLRQEVAEQQQAAESWDAAQLVKWGLERFGSTLSIASSFGAEDVVLVELAARAKLPYRVFTLDTDFLFPESYTLIEGTEKLYGVKVERTRPALTPEAQAAKHGDALWAREPNLCCSIRKVEPLKKMLSSLDAWITGIRRDQTPQRANAKKIDWDAGFGLVKINPLADWTSDDVWKFIRENNIPYNALHDNNYPSIGCTYCTRQVMPGEDPRAGRWSGFTKTECGLHAKE